MGDSEKKENGHADIDKGVEGEKFERLDAKRPKRRMVEREMNAFDALKMYCSIKRHSEPKIEITDYPSAKKPAYVTVRVEGVVRNKLGKEREKSVGRSAIGVSIDEAVWKASKELLEFFAQSHDW